MAEAPSPSEPTCKISHVHIECPICIGRFTDPKILDCLHSFCLKCLEDFVNNQDPKTGTVVCPVCRRETAVPETGLSDLANCFFLSSLVDDVIMQERLQSDTKVSAATCEQCDKGLEADSRCLDCDANICQGCVEAHAQLKFTKNHRIVKTEGLPKNLLAQKKNTESPKCRKHADQELCFYCDTCEVLACLKCVVFDHRTASHELSEIADSVRSHRRTVEEAFQKFDEWRQRFEEADAAIEHSRNRLLLMVDQACLDIVAKEKQEVAKIRSASRLLQEEVTKIGQERADEYDKILISNRDKMNRAEQIKSAVNDLMQQAEDFELLDLKPKVMHNLDFHRGLKFESMKHIKLVIGFKGHDVVNDAHLGEITKEGKWELKTEFGNERKGDVEFKVADGIGCFSNGDILVLDSAAKRLSTFTSTGCYKSTGVHSEIEEGKLEAPWGVVVTSDDLLLVVDGQDVKVYDSNLQYIRQFRPSKNDEGHSQSVISGVDVDKNNRIAVADPGRKVISLHNLDGSKISTVSNEMIGNTCRLVISNKERLIFTNYMESKLVCLDFTGNEVFNISTVFTGRTVKPYGVCCDDAGDIYVSVHYNSVGINEVHHYDADGVHIGRVAHELYNPADLTITPIGDLVVADMHSVKILQNS